MHFALLIFLRFSAAAGKQGERTIAIAIIFLILMFAFIVWIIVDDTFLLLP
jgi:hypothetical protein